MVVAEINDQQCRITVSDCGVRLPGAELPRLFEFYLPPDASGEWRRNGGVGPGLSRQLLHSLGGNIEATVMKGGGANLVVTLPLTSKKRG